MLKKVWFMLVLCSVLMVSGCFGGLSKESDGNNVVSEVESSEMDVAEDLEADVSLEADIDEMENSDISMETEQIERSETEEQGGDVSNSEASTTEESVVNDTTKYVEPPVCHPGYALHKKPSNAFQQRYYGKLYRMCVVQKCRFQYKYTRYQQNLIRMKELQEEYLFLNREGINSWEDVFRAKQTAEQRIADIDAKKKELYKEHVRYKYQYEKDGDVIVYPYHEAHYQEQLAELRERRKEAKRECATINRCISESTFAYMEIPLDVDVENLYMVDVPELEGSDISYAKSEANNS